MIEHYEKLNNRPTTTHQVHKLSQQHFEYLLKAKFQNIADLDAIDNNPKFTQYFGNNKQIAIYINATGYIISRSYNELVIDKLFNC